MSRPYTKEEIVDTVLGQIEMSVVYWDSVKTDSVRDKMHGLVFSILNIFDGTSSLPAFDIIVRPHPDDKQFHIDEDEDYYEDGMVINDGICLHGEWARRKGKVNE